MIDRGPGPIVLIGAEEDDHVAAISAELRARGEPTLVLDALRFPESPRISMGQDLEDIRVDGISLGHPGAIYLRGLYLTPLAYLVDAGREMVENWHKTLVVFREKGEFLVSLVRRWEELNVPIVNSLAASERTRKPYQLARLREAGIPVPSTLWTNDPAEASVFAHHRRVAYKPVSGGAATKEFAERDFDEDRLARLANCPVTFQELVPGKDLRIFVLDGRVLAAFEIEVEKGAVDYRQNEQRIESVTIEPELEELAIRATATLGLRFTGMDLKRAEDGAWKVLELNPSPMFLGFDQHGGTNILRALTDALVRDASMGRTRSRDRR